MQKTEMSKSNKNKYRNCIVKEQRSNCKKKGKKKENIRGKKEKRKVEGTFFFYYPIRRVFATF